MNTTTFSKQSNSHGNDDDKIVAVEITILIAFNKINNILLFVLEKKKKKKSLRDLSITINGNYEESDGNKSS
jgi:hypothetical protein